MIAMTESLNKRDIQVLLDYVNEMMSLFEDDDIENTKSNNGLLLSKSHFIELKYKLENMLNFFE